MIALIFIIEKFNCFCHLHFTINRILKRFIDKTQKYVVVKVCFSLFFVVFHSCWWFFLMFFIVSFCFCYDSILSTVSHCFPLLFVVFYIIIFIDLGCFSLFSVIFRYFGIFLCSRSFSLYYFVILLLG